MFHGVITFLLATSGETTCQLGELNHLMPWINKVIFMPYSMERQNCQMMCQLYYMVCQLYYK